MTINDKPGIKPMEISEIMMLNPSTITRFLEKMEDKNYVVRKTLGKFIEVYPTDKCLNINTKLNEDWKNLYNRYTHILGESHARLLNMTIYEAAKQLERKSFSISNSCMYKQIYEVCFVRYILKYHYPCRVIHSRCRC